MRDALGVEQRICSKCKRLLPVTEFNRRKKDSPYLRSECRDCSTKASVAYRRSIRVCVGCSARLPIASFTLPDGKHSKFCADCRKAGKKLDESITKAEADPSTKLRCSGCKQMLPLDAFDRDNNEKARSRFYRHSECKVCHADRLRLRKAKKRVATATTGDERLYRDRYTDRTPLLDGRLVSDDPKTLNAVLVTVVEEQLHQHYRGRCPFGTPAARAAEERIKLVITGLRVRLSELNKLVGVALNRYNKYDAPLDVCDAASVLGVLPAASPQKIKQAYKEAALIAHPDRAGGSDAEMSRVNDARDVLLKQYPEAYKWDRDQAK
jgi:hypothetical protein